MTKLELMDDMKTVIWKMSEGNPGGLRVCMDLLSKGGDIDTDAAFGGFANLMDLDTLGVYGSRIWLLYKDVCNEELYKMIVVLRSWQLGFISASIIDHAIDNYGEGIDLSDCITKVTEQLKGFKIPEEN